MPCCATAGVIRTRTLEELFDVATLLSHQPVPAGRRVAIVTNAGGPAILAADACESNGLIVPPLSAATQARLRAFLPAAASVTNPVDMIASATPEHFERTIQSGRRGRRCRQRHRDFHSAAGDESRGGGPRHPRGGGGSGTKTVIASFMGGQGVLPMLAPVPSFPFPESAAVALAAVTRYGEWRRDSVEEGVPMPDTRRGTVRGHVERARANGDGWLTPMQCDALLQAAGIPTSRLVRRAPLTKRSPPRARSDSRSCSKPRAKTSSTSRTPAASSCRWARTSKSGAPLPSSWRRSEHS